ncbi:hypothetical protein HDU67_006705 [Dinochytrium kinnereticum]|nr:hypothetical protein HDU67_006705 [Dinochytrium kinnereticum]
MSRSPLISPLTPVGVGGPSLPKPVMTSKKNMLLDRDATFESDAFLPSSPPIYGDLMNGRRRLPVPNAPEKCEKEDSAVGVNEETQLAILFGSVPPVSPTASAPIPSAPPEHDLPPHHLSRSSISKSPIPDAPARYQIPTSAARLTTSSTTSSSSSSSPDCPPMGERIRHMVMQGSDSVWPVVPNTLPSATSIVTAGQSHRLAGAAPPPSYLEAVLEVGGERERRWSQTATEAWRVEDEVDEEEEIMEQVVPVRNRGRDMPKVAEMA